jgi:hypothetical protein
MSNILVFIDIFKIHRFSANTYGFSVGVVLGEDAGACFGVSFISLNFFTVKRAKVLRVRLLPVILY